MIGLFTIASFNVLVFPEEMPHLSLQTHVTGKLKNVECGKTGKRRGIYKIEVEGFHYVIYLDGVPGCKEYIIGSEVDLYTFKKSNGDYEASQFEHNGKLIMAFEKYVERQKKSQLSIFAAAIFMWVCVFFHFRNRNITSQ